MSNAIEEFRKVRKLKVSDATVKRYDHVLKIFCLCMHDPDIEDVTMNDVIGYLSEMDRLGWKRNGISIVAGALRKFFEYYYLQKYDVLDWHLIPLPKKEVNIPRVAEEDDFQKLLKAIPKDTNDGHHKRNRALVRMLYDTGARQGEIRALNVEDLDLKECTAVVKTLKSRGRRPIRQIHWTEETNKEIKVWLKKREHLMGKFEFKNPEALFVTIAKSPGFDWRGKRMSGRSVAEVMRVYSNKAGLPNVMNAHSMRHKMGRDIAKAGGNNSDISNVLGHSSLESSWIYTMTWGSSLRETWERVRGKNK